MNSKKTLVSMIVFIVLAALNMSLALMQSQSDVKAESGYIIVDGGKLFYEIAGRGTNMVLIHDGLIHRETWDAQFPIFSKDYCVIRYDRRGYGKSPKSEKPFSQVEDLRHLLDTLKVSKTCLISMSSGGGLAIDFALKYPDRVESLVLVGAVVSGFSYTEHFNTRGGRIDPSRMVNPDAFIQFFRSDPYIIYPENKAAREKALQLLEANRQNVSPGIYRPLQPERPAIKYLNEIHVPALIVVGEYDIPDVHAHAGAIEAGIVNSKRIIISNAGHLVPMEQPAAFNRIVLQFLKGKDLMALIFTGKINEAIAKFEEARKTDPEVVLFTESEMNQEGYQRLTAGKSEEAIELFKLNALAYPNSANVYDSLGEAYERSGQLELAKKNYEQAYQKAKENNDPRGQLFKQNYGRLQKKISEAN